MHLVSSIHERKVLHKMSKFLSGIRLSKFYIYGKGTYVKFSDDTEQIALLSCSSQQASF